MNVAAQALHRQQTKLGLVDLDIHPRVKSINDLKPYMATRWWDYLQTYGTRRRHGFAKGHPYPKMQPGDGMRRDSWPPSGLMPGADLPFMREQYLDPYGVEVGIMNPLGPSGQGEQNRELAAALASATNDWQLEDWVRLEPRLKASVVVPYEDGGASRAEIEKRGGDPRFAHVLLLSRTAEALGRPRYWPIYEAAVEHGLPVGIHVFGYSGYPISNSGWPSFYIEEMTEHETACSALLTSMIMEGLFERLPDLKIIMIEAGFAWLPALGWRLDKLWKRLKSEVPHLKLAPSEYLRRNVWASTQPMEEPEEPRHLLDTLEWAGWDRIMYASDYPHWDFDDPTIAIPSFLGAERRRMIFSDNARALYGWSRSAPEATQ